MDDLFCLTLCFWHPPPTKDRDNKALEEREKERKKDRQTNGRRETEASFDDPERSHFSPFNISLTLILTLSVVSLWLLCKQWQHAHLQLKCFSNRESKFDILKRRCFTPCELVTITFFFCFPGWAVTVNNKVSFSVSQITKKNLQKTRNHCMMTQSWWHGNPVWLSHTSCVSWFSSFLPHLHWIDWRPFLPMGVNMSVRLFVSVCWPCNHLVTGPPHATPTIGDIDRWLMAHSHGNRQEHPVCRKWFIFYENQQVSEVECQKSLCRILGFRFSWYYLSQYG